MSDESTWIDPPPDAAPRSGNGISPLTGMPPITIGELTDVPAPGSPIESNWAQEATNRIVHRFATTTAMDAWTASDGSMAYVTAHKAFFERINGAWALVSPSYFANTTDRDAVASARRQLGGIAVVGTGTGTTTAMPRWYVWDGTTWMPMGYWGLSGRFGCYYTMASLSVPNVSGVDVPWSTRQWDNDGWIASPPSTLLTCPLTGLYHITCVGTWSTSSLAGGTINLQVAGVNWAGENGPNPFSINSLSATVPITAAQTLKITVYHGGGASISLSTGRIVITRVGA